MNKIITGLFLSFILLSFFQSYSQSSSTPLQQYIWKGSKTQSEAGYVVLKSGKTLEGNISLKGSVNGVTEINFEGDGKKISFPPGALKSYGLIRKNVTSSNSASVSGPISESPESMYEWKDAGVVMDKVITVTKPRDGYVILKTGKKINGLLKLKRKDGILTNWEVKPVAGKKSKGGIEEVARYGYNISAESVAQENLANKAMSSFMPGSIETSSGIQKGEISQVNQQGKFYSSVIIFKDSSGKLTEYQSAQIKAFSQLVNGQKNKYISIGDAFVKEEFNGSTFRLYRNPAPTTINKFATNLTKSGAQLATNAAAQAIVNKDAKKNGYISNMDSVIAVSTKEELINLRDALAELGGYSSAAEAQEKSNNESLKNNLFALDLAISGDEISNSTGGILNEEWIIENTLTGEKTIVYKAEYKSIIEPLLKGCYTYLSMSKAEQNSYNKWNALQKTVALLDDCY